MNDVELERLRDSADGAMRQELGAYGLVLTKWVTIYEAVDAHSGQKVLRQMSCDNQYWWETAGMLSAGAHAELAEVGYEGDEDDDE